MYEKIVLKKTKNEDSKLLLELFEFQCLHFGHTKLVITTYTLQSDITRKKILVGLLEYGKNKNHGYFDQYWATAQTLAFVQLKAWPTLGAEVTAEAVLTV